MRNISGFAARVDPTMEKSTPDQLAWIRERFEGKSAGSNCRPMPVDPGNGPPRPLPSSGQE
jgi:hypothetical protein